MTRTPRDHPRRNGRKPVFDGDLDENESVTEAIARIIPEWDGRTVIFAGESGSLPRQSGQDTEPFARSRRRRVPVAPPAPPAPPAPAAAPHDPAPGPQPDPRHDIIGRDLLHGWPHLEEIRCTYPAANHATPIPCGRTYTDDAAGTIRDLNRSAWAAGWHLDAFGQWACPSCCQGNGQYRTLYPLTCWHPGAATARLAGDTAAEFWLQREAEIAVALRTSQAFAAGHRRRRAGA